MNTPHHQNSEQRIHSAILQPTSPGAAYEQDPTIWGARPRETRERLREAIFAIFRYLEVVGPDLKSAAGYVASSGTVSDMSISKELESLVQLTAALNDAMGHSLTWIRENYPKDVEETKRFFSAAAAKSATAVIASARAMTENPNANLLRAVAPADRQAAIELRERYVSSFQGKDPAWKPRRNSNASLRDPNKEFVNGLQRSVNAGSRQGSRVQSLLPDVKQLIQTAGGIINQASVSSQTNELETSPSRADVVPGTNSDPVKQPQPATAA